MTETDNDEKARTTSDAAPPPSTAAGPDSGSERRGRGSESPRTGAPESSPEEVANLAYKLEFGVGKSLRYHAKRRGWFENWHSAAMGASVVSASAAFATVTGQFPEYSRWIAIVLAIFTAADLVFGFYRRAQSHARLYQRFAGLAADMATKARPSESEVRRWKAERHRIEADEPPVLDTLNVMCHNEEAESRGLGREHIRRLSVLDRVLAQITSLKSSYKPL